jgi:predicted tellurium resistance membrane protein TerC
MKDEKPTSRAASLWTLPVVFAVPSVVATLGGTSWRQSLAIFAAATALGVPVCVWLTRTRERAASASFWLVGALFVFPVFAMGSGELGVALAVPALREPLSPWLSPARTRLVVWAVCWLAGLLSGLAIWWAAWLHFPLRRRAA